MREYELRIHVNAWNAIRYVVITLVMVPLAEKLWDLSHSRRTGQRIMRGRAARLRQSKLAHWGLHQEVDENSRLSKVLAISVCVLHIAGALLLEYGSGSMGTYILQDAMLSQTLRDDGDLRPTGAYFVDASYVFGGQFGPTDCIDGAPRNLSDFGLRMEERPAFTIVSSLHVPEPNSTNDLKKAYLISNSGWRFQVYDNGSTRWYAVHNDDDLHGAPTTYVGFINETISCQRLDRSSFSCSEYEEEVENRNLLSKVLANTVVAGVTWANMFLMPQNRELSLNLNRVSIMEMQQGHEVESNGQTAWVRNGMPRDQTTKGSGIHLALHIKGLEDGCTHKHAVHVADPDKLSGLRVSNSNFSTTQQAWILDQQDHKLFLLTSGNAVSVGTLMQFRNEYCSFADVFSLCIKRLSSSKHVLAFYMFAQSAGHTMQYTKIFSFSVDGRLHKTEALNLAVQGILEAVRKNQFSLTVRHMDIQRRITKLVKSGRVYSGFVRVLGTQVKGKSVLRLTDVATIDILGIVGVVLLTVLVAVPIPMVFYYRKSLVVDVESSFRRAVMVIKGIHSCQEELDRVPSIVARDEGDGTQLEFDV